MVVASDEQSQWAYPISPSGTATATEWGKYPPLFGYILLNWAVGPPSQANFIRVNTNPYCGVKHSA